MISDLWKEEVEGTVKEVRNKTFSVTSGALLH